MTLSKSSKVAARAVLSSVMAPCERNTCHTGGNRVEAGGIGFLVRPVTINTLGEYTDTRLAEGGAHGVVPASACGQLFRRGIERNVVLRTLANDSHDYIPRSCSVAMIPRPLRRPPARRPKAERDAILVLAPKSAPTQWSPEPTASLSIPLSAGSQDILAYVDPPPEARKPVGYQRAFLDAYRPDATWYFVRVAAPPIAHYGENRRR